MQLKIKKMDEYATIPTCGSAHAAGYDLYAHNVCDVPGLGNFGPLMRCGFVIPPHATTPIHTGICVEIPNGYFGAVFPRSGLATKRGLRLANCVGVIDSDYRGEIIVPLHNDSSEEQVINHGDRIAQLVILPYAPLPIVEVDELSETGRGTGGFGSTGISKMDDTYEQMSLFDETGL